jgi:hypothetical protein
MTLVAVTLLFAGCNLDTMSKEDLVDGFIDDVENGNQGDLYTYLADSVSVRNAAKAPLWWESTPFAKANDPHSFDSLSIGGSTATVSHTGFGIGTDTVIFTFKEQDEDDWRFSRIQRGATDIQ